MQRRAKIVGTVGPSSSSVEILEKLIKAGLNVARVNMSHGTYEAHEATIKAIRDAGRNVGVEVAILCDLQGPKIRVDKLPTPLILKENDIWVIGQSDVAPKYPQYKDCFIPTVYKNLVKDAHVGAVILFDDGLMEAVAIAKEDDVFQCSLEGSLLGVSDGNMLWPHHHRHLTCGREVIGQ